MLGVEFFCEINMGEGGKKLDQQDVDRDLLSEQGSTKRSGTRLMVRNAGLGGYSLGRGVVPTDRPGIFEEEEIPTRVDIPQQIPLRSDIAALADVEPTEISAEVVDRINTNMASDHPSAPRDASLPTMVDPINVKARCREAGVEDDLPGEGTVLIDSEQLPNVIDIRRKQQELARGIILRASVHYAWPWWESNDSLVKIWCQINGGLRALPDWQFKKELESLITDERTRSFCMRSYEGKLTFSRVDIERALLERFSQAEIDVRFAYEKDLITAKKVTKR